MLLSHLASKPYGQSRIFQREKENLYCGKRSSKPRPGDTIVLRTLLLFSDKKRKAKRKLQNSRNIYLLESVLL